jgi:hypothetical protein
LNLDDTELSGTIFDLITSGGYFSLDPEITTPEGGAIVYFL